MGHGAPSIEVFFLVFFVFLIRNEKDLIYGKRRTKTTTSKSFFGIRTEQFTARKKSIVRVKPTNQLNLY